jgi:K+-sensing histidine kinase KdpD
LATFTKSKLSNLRRFQPIDYRGRVFEEKNTDAILRRSPQIVWSTNWRTNVPGSELTKLWEDDQVLFGIEVWTTTNS